MVISGGLGLRPCGPAPREVGSLTATPSYQTVFCEVYTFFFLMFIGIFIGLLQKCNSLKHTLR